MGSTLMIDVWQEKRRPFQPQGVSDTELVNLLQAASRDDAYQGCGPDALQCTTRMPTGAATFTSTASLAQTLNENPGNTGRSRLGPVSSWAVLSVSDTNGVNCGDSQRSAGAFPPILSGGHPAPLKHSVEASVPLPPHHLQAGLGMRMSALRDPGYNARALLARHEQLQAQKQLQRQQQLLQLQPTAQQYLQTPLQQNKRRMLTNASVAALGTGPYPNQHSFARSEQQAGDIGGAFVEQTPYNVGMDASAAPQPLPAPPLAPTVGAPVSWQPLHTPNLSSQTAPFASAVQHPAQQLQSRTVVPEAATDGTAEMGERVLAVRTGSPWPSNASQVPMSPMSPIASPAWNPADCNNLGMLPASIPRKRLAIDGLIGDSRRAITAPGVLSSLNNADSGPIESPLLLSPGSRQVCPVSWGGYPVGALGNPRASFGSISQQHVAPPVPVQQQQQQLEQQQQEPIHHGLQSHVKESGGNGASGGPWEQGCIRISGSSGASEGNQGAERTYDRHGSPRPAERDEDVDGDEDDYDPDNNSEVVPGSASRARKKQARSPAGPVGAGGSKGMAKVQGRPRGPRVTTVPRYRDGRRERLLELQARVAKQAEVITALQARLRQLEEEAGVLTGGEGPDGPPPGGVGPELATTGNEGLNGTPPGGEGPGALGEGMEIGD